MLVELTTWSFYVYLRWVDDSPPWDPLDEDGDEDPFDPVTMLTLVQVVSPSHAWDLQEIRDVNPSAHITGTEEREVV